MLMSSNLERALRWAAECHLGQVRKASGAPYIEHVVGVAMIVDRLGFDEDVVIGALLHDVVEDTDATLEDVRARFGGAVAEIVRHCSEVKTDDEGRKRPWIDRKRDHLAALIEASAPARAVVLADKLHNLVSIECDLRDGLPVWSHFHAERSQVLWYYRTAIETLGFGDARLDALESECRALLEVVEGIAS